MKQTTSVKLRQAGQPENIENLIEISNDNSIASLICRRTGNEIDMDYVLQGSACYFFDYQKGSSNHFWCPYEVDMYLNSKEGYCPNLELVIKKNER